MSVSIVQIMQNLPYFLILIGPLVFFHELGHFLVARWFGVRVLRFSLGFGPKLLGFTRNGTEYMIAAIPLGGYVKMWGWGEDIAQDMNPTQREGSFLALSLPKRALIVLAGPLMNLMLAGFVYALPFAQGVPDLSTKIGHVLPSMPAAQAGLEPGDEIIGINDTPITYWDDLQERISKADDGATLKLAVRRDGQTREVMIKPNVAEERDQLQQPIKRGRIGILSTRYAPVIDVSPDSPASRAGLQLGDEITSVNGTPVSDWFGFNKLMRGAKDARVEVTAKRKGGELQFTTAIERAAQDKERGDAHLRPDPEALFSGITSFDTRIAKVEKDSPASKLGLQAGDHLVSIQGKPISAWRIDLLAFDGADATKEFQMVWSRGDALLSGVMRIPEVYVEDELKTPTRSYSFGATNERNAERLEILTHTYAIPAAVAMGFNKMVKSSKMTLRALGLMITLKMSAKNLGGPILLFNVAEKAAALGVSTFMEVMAMVSVSLGVMNLLPVPVLDGGQLMFIAAEAVRRKPLSMRAREYAIYAGLVMLLLIMAVAFTNDIVKFIL